MPQAWDSQKRHSIYYSGGIYRGRPPGEIGFLEETILLQILPSIMFPRTIQTLASKPVPSQSHTEGAISGAPLRTLFMGLSVLQGDHPPWTHE